MDWYDYCFKFSSELLVLTFVLLVGGLNIYFFGFNGDRRFTDNSHAAKFLTYHTDLNPKLYAQQTSINTVIVTPKGFISQASAEDLPSLQTSSSYEAESGNEDPIPSLNEGAMVKSNPDSIQGLIAKQIKIYQTQPGDTLKSIAGQFGISTQTIIWANNLSGSTIKPDWYLVILPVDGTMHKAGNNDTIPDIAKKYSVSMETIIAYNGLDNAEDIEPGQIFILPGGRVPEPPKPKPAAPAPRDDSKVNPGITTTPKIYAKGTGHIFPWGYCTWYVATKVHVPWGGNAKNWLANARSYGAIISKTAAVGSIVVTTDNSRYGHVAYVESVDEKGFTISEMNYKAFGKVNTRWISHTSKIIRGFIHP